MNGSNEIREERFPTRMKEIGDVLIDQLEILETTGAENDQQFKGG